MNIHHLELFYYVAKHGGISAALRHIPYGIQQPAVSGQIRQLERDVGVKLFERQPFRLTAEGARLFLHVRPFFESLKAVVADIRSASEPELRFGGAELVLRDHISVVMRQVRKLFPKMRLSLHSGFQAQVEDWLRNGQIDVAVTSVGPRPPSRLRQLVIVQIPLVLVVHRKAPWKSAEELWAQKKIREPLIGQPAVTSIMQGFQRDLRKRKIRWPQTIEVTSVELITRYVANGEGIGVNLGIPSVNRLNDVRVLPLKGFEPMSMGAVWRGEPTDLVRAAIKEVCRYSHQTFPDWVVADKLP